MKVTFGGMSPKFRQTNWNVAITNVNVIVDELPSQVTIYTCLKLIYGLDGLNAHQCGFMCFGAIPQNGGLPMKMAPRVFDFTMDTPSSPESA